MTMAMLSATMSTAMSVTAFPSAAIPVMTAVIAVPMITVFLIMAIANDRLIPAAAIVYIPGPYLCMMNPWTWLIYYHFITVINIIVTIWTRQVGAVNPYIVSIINILMCIYIIIGVYIWDIIIINMVIANRPPVGLASNIYTNAKMHLCIG